MRVLLTNNTLAERAGTELYVRDIALALRARGHEPWAYSSKLGEVARELREAGILVLDDLSGLREAPDLIHAHHHLDAMAALLRFPRVPAVLFCHGARPWEEAPARFPSILRYVAVDDACSERLLAEGVPSGAIEVLRTFVDLDRFPLRAWCRPRPRRALVFSNNARFGPYLWGIRLGCALAGIFRVDVAGREAGRAVARPEDVLARYDVVFAKGRAAHEAAASGAALMVSDYGRHAGLLTRARYEEWRPLNFGFRLLKRRAGPLWIARELARYDAAEVRAVALRLRAEAGLGAFMERLLALYEDIASERALLAALPQETLDAAASGYLRGLATQVKGLIARPSLPRRALNRLGRLL